MIPVPPLAPSRRRRPPVLRIAAAAAVLLACGAAPAWSASPATPTSGSTAGGTAVTVVDGSAGFQQLAAGSNGGYVIDGDGQVFAWGFNSWGQLGNGGTTNSSVPVRVSQGAIPAGVTITRVAGADDGAYALGSDGQVYAWGRNLSGQLGNGSVVASSTVPVRVQLPAGVTATAIGAGYTSGYALTGSGAVYSWGSNSDGQLGNGNIGTDQSTPVLVQQGAIPAGVTLVSLAAGQVSAYGVGSDGHVYAWGGDAQHQLGDGNSTAQQSAPVQVQQGAIPIGVTLTSAAAGQGSAYALGSDGRAYAWGDNGLYQLGDGTTTVAATPVQVLAGSVPSGVTLTAVAAGSATGYVLGSDGDVYAWGYNASGQVGAGVVGDQPAPVQAPLPGGLSAVALAAGYHIGFALGSDGNVYGAGEGGTRQGDGTGNGRDALGLSANVALTGVSLAGATPSDLVISGGGATFHTAAHAAGAVPLVLSGSVAGGAVATGLTATRTTSFSYLGPAVSGGAATLAATGSDVPPWIPFVAVLATLLGAVVLVREGRRRLLSADSVARGSVRP